MPDNNPSYIGRFAPSPTGDLHFGSLVAAVGSYLQAKSQGGQWLIRMEDLDPPREVPGSAQGIIDQLARLGMTSDHPIIYQSQRGDSYQPVLDKLLEDSQAFWCGCSRKSLPRGEVYPGTCRQGLAADKQPRTIRLKTRDQTLTVEDGLQGTYSQNMARDVGDFIIRRADGLTAYQLAVVLDDAAQGITEVVRGYDLLGSTPRQIYLQQLLGLPTPAYVHLPIAVNQGLKLSKQRAAPSIHPLPAVMAIELSLKFLGHPPPCQMKLDTLWDWAIDHWSLEQVPKARELTAPEIDLADDSKPGSSD